MCSRVGEKMSREFATAASDSPLTRVLQELVRTRNKSLPVADGARLVGIVACEDVLEALGRDSVYLPSQG